MNCRFEYADKNKMEDILPQLFEILYSNMSLKYPTGNTRDDDYRIWCSSFTHAMKDEKRQLILMVSNETIIGYFQYTIIENTLKMEDLQTEKEYHGSGLFGVFYAWLVRQLPHDIQKVEALTDKRNIKTQGILEHIGLINCGENKNGKSYHYKGDYKALLYKYI